MARQIISSSLEQKLIHTNSFLCMTERRKVLTNETPLIFLARPVLCILSMTITRIVIQVSAKPSSNQVITLTQFFANIYIISRILSAILVSCMIKTDVDRNKFTAKQLQCQRDLSRCFSGNNIGQVTSKLARKCRERQNNFNVLVVLSYWLCRRMSTVLGAA